MDRRQATAPAKRNDTAELLKRHQDEITHVWESRCRREVPAAARLDHAVLLDSLEVVIENLCALLRSHDGTPQEICYDNVCSEHGRTRARLPGYTLEQTIFEYHLLREAIFQVLPKYAPIADEDRELIVRAMEQAVQAVSRSFVKSSDPSASGTGDIALVGGFSKTSFGFAISSALIAIGSLIGWWGGNEMLRTWLPGLAPMSIVTAICVFAVSGSLMLLRGDNLTQFQRLFGFVLATCVAWLCVLNLTDRAQLQAINERLAASASPGSDAGAMSLLTSISLLLISLALLFSDWRHRWGVRTSQWLALLGGSIGAWTLIDYAYSVLQRNLSSNTNVSLPAAFALFLSATGVLFAHPGRGPVSILASRRAGGFIARRVILASLLLPVIVGSARLLTERTGVVTTTMGTAAVVVICMLVFASLVLWSARALNQVEFERDRYLEEVQGAILRREQLHRHVQTMESERKLREEFVSMLSHDLRGPLTAAKTSAELGIRYPDKHENHAKLFQRINNNITRIDHMIRDLLDANRIRAGEPLPVRVEQCELVSLTRTALEELAVIHGDRFRLEAPERIDGHWACDSLIRMIENLCSNAVKYGSAEREIRVQLEEAGSEVRLSVTNWGNPIPPEQQARIFEPFHRTPGAAESGQTGWGLGLALVRGLAKSHQGQVSLRSSEDEGTTFTVTLPRDARPAQSSSAVQA